MNIDIKKNWMYIAAGFILAIVLVSAGVIDMAADAKKTVSLTKSVAGYTIKGESFSGSANIFQGTIIKSTKQNVNCDTYAKAAGYKYLITSRDNYDWINDGSAIKICMDSDGRVVKEEPITDPKCDNSQGMLFGYGPVEDNSIVSSTFYCSKNGWETEQAFRSCFNINLAKNCELHYLYYSTSGCGLTKQKYTWLTKKEPPQLTCYINCQPKQVLVGTTNYYASVDLRSTFVNEYNSSTNIQATKNTKVMVCNSQKPSFVKELQITHNLKTFGEFDKVSEMMRDLG